MAYTFLPFASFFLLNRSADHGGKRNAGSPGSDDHPLPAFVELRRHETEDRHCFFLFIFPVSSTTSIFLSNPGTGVVVQVGNGHMALDTPKQT